jgi:DNA mismatch repair protein MutS
VHDLAETSQAPPRSGAFRSILFGEQDADTAIDDRPQPECFPDLNLDQVVDAIAAGRKGYRLTGYFNTPLTELDAIRYRQEVFRDLETDEPRAAITTFAEGMVEMRDRLGKANKAYYELQKRRWFLDAARKYCDSVAQLRTALNTAEFASRGLRAITEYLDEYVASTPFTALRDEATEVRRRLDALRYNVLVKGNRVTVGPYDNEADYTAQVVTTFERFQQGEVDEHRTKIRGYDDMNHVEAQILELVAKVFPGPFEALNTFCERHSGYLDPIIGTFDREVQFYLGYLAYIAPLRRAGLELSYPDVSADSKQENAADTFDLALAAQLVLDDKPVVVNDIRLDDPERILVVSGPNNGGKTTLARTVGQLHYLARLGCPVPGRDVRLFRCDAIYTHFEKEEDITTLAGKLQEELDRMRADFDRATPDSLLITNEMFSSTTLDDARFLSKEMLRRITELDALGVCVTFIDELASLNEKTVSMVSTVVPGDLASRTFKLVRRPADGRAYAHALAEKYRLDYETLKGRVNGR